MDNRKRREEGLIYHYDDPSIMDDQQHYQELLYEYNQTRPTENDKKQELLKQMLASIGEGCHIETPFHANWGGKHVHFGNGIYCNSNLTLVDDGNIYIGDQCMIAPNVVIATAGHPILPILREHRYVYTSEVHIDRNVWIGSGVQILPGVHIGENSVIGAGSVVTHDIPANVVAYGVPCKVIREIGEKDRIYYMKDKKLDVWE